MVVPFISDTENGKKRYHLTNEYGRPDSYVSVLTDLFIAPYMLIALIVAPARALFLHGITIPGIGIAIFHTFIGLAAGVFAAGLTAFLITSVALLFTVPAKLFRHSLNTIQTTYKNQ